MHSGFFTWILSRGTAVVKHTLVVQFWSCEQGDLSNALVCTDWTYQHTKEFSWLSFTAVGAAVVPNTS